MIRLGTPLASALMDLSSSAPARLLRSSRKAEVLAHFTAEGRVVEEDAQTSAAAAEVAAKAAQQAAATVAAATLLADSGSLLEQRSRVVATELACERAARRADLAALGAEAAAHRLEAALIPIEQPPCSKATQLHSY